MVNLFLSQRAYRHTIIIFSLFACSFSSVGQDIMLLRDGRQIPLSKWKIKDGKISVKPTEGENLVLDPWKVEGYYRAYDETFLHLRTVDSTDAENYAIKFLSVLEEGKLNLLQETVRTVGTANTPGQTFLYYFLSDHTKTRRLAESSIFGKKFDTEVLSSMTRDYDTLSAQAKIEPLNIKDIARFVRRYNNHFYQPPAADGAKSTVFFYLKDNKEEHCTISIAGGLAQALKPFQANAVSLPVDAYTQVCISVNETKECDLFQSSRFVMRYIEVNLSDKKDGVEITFESTPSWTAIKRMQTYLQWKKKSAGK